MPADICLFPNIHNRNCHRTLSERWGAAVSLTDENLGKESRQGQEASGQ